MGPLHTLGSFEDRAPASTASRCPGLDADGRRRPRQPGRRAAGRRPTATDAARWLTEQTAGNPLLVQEILRGLDAATTRSRRCDAAREPAARPGARRRALAARAARPRHERGAGRRVRGRRAVLARRAGRHRSSAAWSTCGTGSTTPPGPACVRDADDGDTLAFAHAVVRRALQDDVPPDRARRPAPAHRPRAQRGLRPPAGPPPRSPTTTCWPPTPTTAALAIRWGRDRRRPGPARDRVRGRGVVPDAGGRRPRPLRRRRPAPGRELACELRLDLADAHDRAGEFIARDRRHLEAAELARALDRTDLFARAALGFGGRLPAVAPPQPRRPAACSTRRSTGCPARQPRPGPRCSPAWPRSCTPTPPHDERRAIVRRGRGHGPAARRPGRAWPRCWCRACLALDGPDDVDDHLDIGAEVIRIGEQTGDPDLVLQGARARIHPLFVVGAHDAARDLADAVHRARRAGAPPRPPAPGRACGRSCGPASRASSTRPSADGRRARGCGSRSPATRRWRCIHLMQTFVVRWLHGRLAEPRRRSTAMQLGPQPTITWWALRRLGRRPAWATSTRALSRLADRPTADLRGRRRRLPVADRGGRAPRSPPRRVA